ncbi:hypothetical protein [Petrimonas sp.]|uniref:hypothetical protein n=1 Tax=Petrimonas sp. TaxID=2023866 RepID=UPI003F518D37
MNEKLIYSVAGHLFSIETPDRRVTSKIMSNYEPFYVENNERDDFLFHLKGGEKVDIPEIPSDDTLEWNGVSYNVYHTPQGAIVSMKQDKRERRFLASLNWKEIVSDLTLTDESEAAFLNSFLRLAYGMTSINRRTIKIHASVTELNGKTLIFLGKSGTGKSTHSRLWREFVPGCTLLNDDEPLVRVFENEPVRVYGAPWSGSTPCYRNESAEVVAFVHLYQSPENKLTKLKSIEALSSLYTSAALLRSDIDNKNKVMDVVTEVLQRVPVYRLDCRPDYEAVSLTRSLLP